jgi:hypothetical protein
MPDRTMTKEVWKIFYRMRRITARECQAAMIDLMVYGTAYTRMGPSAHDGFQHIPIDKVDTRFPKS